MSFFAVYIIAALIWVVLGIVACFVAYHGSHDIMLMEVLCWMAVTAFPIVNVALLIIIAILLLAEGVNALGRWADKVTVLKGKK